MILSQAKSGSFLQRRSVMPGGGGKSMAQHGGKGGNGADGFVLNMFYILVGQGRYFGKISPGYCSHFDWLIMIGYEVLPKLSGRWPSEMGEVQLQVFHKMLQHHHTQSISEIQEMN